MSQEVNTIFRHNNVEYAFDIRDAEYAEKFELAIEAMQEEEKALDKVGKLSAQTRGQCKLIKDFFNRCIGEGAGDAICTERDNSVVCFDAYAAFLKYIKAQRNDVFRAKDAFTQHSNRQQRRHPDQNNQQLKIVPNQNKRPK